MEILIKLIAGLFMIAPFIMILWMVNKMVKDNK